MIRRTTARALPDGWQAVRLGDVADLNQGLWDPSDGSSILYLDLTSVVEPGKLSAPVEMPAEAAPSRARRRVRAGDILVSTVRPYLRGFARVREAPENLIASTGFAVLTPQAVSDGSILYHHVMSPSFARHLEANMTGQAYPAVRPDDVAAYQLSLPPLAEQRAIAAVLDAIDEAIERTEEVIAAAERLRDALLHELLTRGLPGRHSEWADVPSLGTVPACWEVTTVGRCLERIEAGSSPRCESRPARGDEWGVLKVSSVSWGVFKPAENKALLEPSDIEPRYEVKDGDLILSRANTPDLVGRAVLVRVPPTRLLLSDKTLRLVPDPARIDREFLLSSLRLPRSRSQIAGAATGSSRSMFNVSQDNIRKVRVALPPLGEQQAIAAALDGVDGATERAREERARLHSLQASAADALLTGRVRVATWMSERQR